MFTRPDFAAAFAAMLLAAPAVLADQVAIQPSADATIYEDLFGDAANGAGDFLFIGRDNSSSIKRTLLRFDIAAAVPAGATINNATLTMFCSRTLVGAHPARLHTALASWTEGTANPTGNEGAPAQAQSGDVTWIFRSYATNGTGPRWNNPGGDYAPVPTATASVAGENQSYSWASAELTAEVQAWLDDPASNFGWFLIGDEDAFGRTAKRFDSRTNPATNQRPTLIIDFTADSPACNPADIAAPFGVLDLADIQSFIAAFTTADPAADLAAPLGVFDLADIQTFIAAFNAGCP